MKTITRAMALAGALLVLRVANASVPIVGGPTYDNTTGNGYMTFVNSGEPLLVNDSGLAVAVAIKQLWPSSLGYRGVRWNAAGSLSVELPGLGAAPNGDTDIEVGAAGLNNSNVAVGYSTKNVDVGNARVPVRWDGLGDTVTEMPQRIPGIGDLPHAINAAGVSVGGRSLWNAEGTAVTTLQALPADTTGVNTWAVAINDSGMSVGYGHDFSVNVFDNERPVRWDAAGNITTLGVLGYAADGHTQARARAINKAGTAIGFSLKYNAQHVELGSVGVRWDPNSTDAIELGGLGVDVNGDNEIDAYAINSAGTIVGVAGKYDASGNLLDLVSVRWDPGATTPTELASLVTPATGVFGSEPLDINESGLIVGTGRKYSNNDNYDFHAVYWDTSGKIVDLNSLIDASSGWVLTSANSVSDNGWIAGIGLYDPDGAGGQIAYARFYTLQIPEPSALALFGLTCAALPRRRR